MTLTSRPPLALPLLALPLAVSVLACDASGFDDSRFRDASALVEPDTTVVLGAQQAPVRVISYRMGERIGDALDAEGFDALLAGAEGITADAQLVLRLDGVAPLWPGGFDEAFVQLRRDGEVLDMPYSRFNFNVEVSGSGPGVTELVFDRSLGEGDLEGRLWRDDGVATAASAAVAVHTIDYELVAADGTSASCRTRVSQIERLGFGYTHLDDSTGEAEFDIADDCVEVPESAARGRPAEAFFVRCDAETTTSTVGVRNVSNVTLKRGVFRASGELVTERVTL